MVILLGYHSLQHREAWPRHGKQELLAELDMSHSDRSATFYIIVAKGRPWQTGLWTSHAYKQLKFTLIAQLHALSGCGLSSATEQHESTQHAAHSMSALHLQRQSAEAAVRRLAMSEWQQATHIRMSDKVPSPIVVAALNTVSWPEMWGLVLSHTGLDAAGLAALAKGHWPKLSTLDISRNKLKTAGMKELVQGSFPSLDHLDVSINLLDDTAVAHFVHGQWPLLHTLVLNRNEQVTANGIAAIMGQWPQLASLQMTHIAPTFALLGTLSQVHGHALTSVDLGHVNLSTDVMSGLTQVQLPILQYLRMKSCSLGADAMAVLARVHMPRLRCLDLMHNRLDEEAMNTVITAQWPCLQSLRLTENCLNDTAMQILCRGGWHRLNHLYLDGNNITVLGIQYLQARVWPVLWALTLSKQIVSENNWAMLGLAPELLSRVTCGKCQTSIRVQRDVSGSDMQWPQLRHITFVTRTRNVRHTAAWDKADLAGLGCCIVVLAMMAPAVGSTMLQAGVSGFVATLSVSLIMCVVATCVAVVATLVGLIGVALAAVDLI